MVVRKFYTLEEIQRGFSLALERTKNGIPGKYVDRETYRRVSDNDFHRKELQRIPVSEDIAFGFVLHGFSCIETFLGEKVAECITKLPGLYHAYRSLLDVRLIGGKVTKLSLDSGNTPDIQSTILSNVLNTYVRSGFPSKPLETLEEVLQGMELPEDLHEAVKMAISESMDDFELTFH